MILWSEDMSVGVNGLDSDHRVLIDTINLLSEAVQEDGKPVDDCDDLLASALTILADYTVIHFGREEKILHEIGFPKSDEHAEEHRHFWDGVTERAEDPAVLAAWLENWLTWHIMGSDQQYAVFIRQQGLSVDLPPMDFSDLEESGHKGRRVELGGVEV